MIRWLLLLAFGVACIAGCQDGVDQKELFESQKQIEKAKTKGPDAWQD